MDHLTFTEAVKWVVTIAIAGIVADLTVHFLTAWWKRRK